MHQYRTPFAASKGNTFGGCPHAPGASGNASSEDLAFMLADMGISTGIDIRHLLALRAKLAQWLSNETLHNALWLAGRPKTFSRDISRALSRNLPAHPSSAALHT